jgi:glycosyltransferase involved in cell wall biosynthesis
MESNQAASGPTVSVVIPCWRCADVIGRAVASVAAQTLQAREIILVDDASGDGTLPALHALASQFPAGKIKVLSLPRNGGPGIARNAGWDAAQSDHVAFLDADDAWHSRKLEIQMDWMLRHPGVELCGHASLMWEQGRTEPPVADAVVAKAVSLFDILYANPLRTRSIVVKRAVPLRFQGHSILEDHLLWIEMVASGRKCVVLDCPLAFCFRPEFSAGGYSGNLWRTELRELNALAWARREGALSPGVFCAASLWSLLKYVRRVAIRTVRALRAQGREGALA